MTPLLDYVVHDLMWAVIGFALGLLLGLLIRDVGRTARGVERLADAIGDEEDTMPVRLTRWRPSWQVGIGILVFALGVATVGEGMYQNASIQRVSDCQTAYTTGFADALDARSAASSSAQDALDSLMTTVGDAMTHADANSRSTVQKAVSDYLQARAKSKATAADHPYPVAPRNLCK